MEPIRIDGAGEKVGRLASRIATILQGKHIAQFQPHKVGKQKVVVTNTDKLVFTGKKMAQKRYYRHTGTIGHLRETVAEKLFQRDSRLVLKHAVRGMLPKNRLITPRLKNLVLYKEGETR